MMLLAKLPEIPTQLAVWTVLLLAAGVLLTPRLRWGAIAVLGAIFAALAIFIGVTHSPPLVAGTMTGAIGLVCLIPPSRADLRAWGAVFMAIGLGFVVYAVATGNVRPASPEILEWAVFGVLALTAVGASIAMICSRNAVYSAIWFAMALLATGGLFLYQGAQFLGVATVVVYAGAIVVTFLFVIMLAQPGGHAVYDRLSWGWFAKPAAALAAALLMSVVLFALEDVDDPLRAAFVAATDDLVADNYPIGFESRDIARVRYVTEGSTVSTHVQFTEEAGPIGLTADEKEMLRKKVAEKLKAKRHPDSETIVVVPGIVIDEPLKAAQDPQADRHMAHLGGYLFSRHLIAVEVAGTLLLAALVGAIAMLSSSEAAARRPGGTHV